MPPFPPWLVDDETALPPLPPFPPLLLEADSVLENEMVTGPTGPLGCSSESVVGMLVYVVVDVTVTGMVLVKVMVEYCVDVVVEPPCVLVVN